MASARELQACALTQAELLPSRSPPLVPSHEDLCLSFIHLFPWKLGAADHGSPRRIPGIESPPAWLPVFTVCLARFSEDPHQLLAGAMSVCMAQTKSRPMLEVEQCSLSHTLILKWNSVLGPRSAMHSVQFCLSVLVIQTGGLDVGTGHS